MCLVIVNNGGCGIFSFLPIAAHPDVFPRFFDNPHSVEFGRVSRMFGLEYRRAATRSDFDACMEEAQQSATKHYVIEAVTQVGGADNVQLHRDLGELSSKAVREAIADSVSLAWAWEGDASRPPVVCLHGFLGCKEDWGGPVTASLIASGWSVLSVDLPGHGESVPSGRGAWIASVALSADYAAEAVLGLLAQLGIVDGVVIVGYSMGGRVAMRMLDRLGSACAACVVIGAHPGLAKGAGEERRARLVADEAQAAGLRVCRGDGAFKAWLERWYSQPLFAGARASSGYDGMLKRRLGGDPEMLAEALVGHSLARQPELWGALSRGTPVLYVAGGGDAKYAAIASRVNEQQREGGGRARGEVVEGAGHALLEEAPEALSGLICDFLAEIHASASKRCKMSSIFAETPSRGGHMIAGARVRRFSVALSPPLELSRGVPLAKREGLVLEISTMGGDVGLGECTPLPGFHAETTEECEGQLKQLCRSMVGRIIPRDVTRLTAGCFETWLYADPGSLESFAAWHVGDAQPSEARPTWRANVARVVVACVEAAVVQAAAHAEEVPVSLMVSAGVRRGLRSHVLLNGLAMRSEVVASGAGDFEVLKVKVGGKEGPKADAIRVGGFADCGRRLRLDANQVMITPSGHDHAF